MRRRALKLSALALALMLAMVTMALATRTVRIASHVTIKSAGLTFSGRVTASKAACEVHRKVRLYRKGGPLLLGSTTTNSSGHWKITASGFAGISLGHFYATVKQRSEGTAGTIYVCKAAISSTIPFHQ